MEQLRAELSHLLGEKLSRIECVNEKADTALWALYDSQGNPMPLMARSFSTPGKARQLAWKTTMLARSGTVRMPTIYGVMTHEEHPGPDVLLLERITIARRTHYRLLKVIFCFRELRFQAGDLRMFTQHQAIQLALDLFLFRRR